MEQKQRRDASSSPQPEPVITKGGFFKELTVEKHDRFTLVFSILNTLHQLQDSDRWCCYCSEKKSFWTKIISKGVPCWLPSCCQIRIIPETFGDFETFVDNHRNTGKYWRVSLSESIRYSNDIRQEITRL